MSKRMTRTGSARHTHDLCPNEEKDWFEFEKTGSK
jgi:hypothetical protein